MDDSIFDEFEKRHLKNWLYNEFPYKREEYLKEAEEFAETNPEDFNYFKNEGWLSLAKELDWYRKYSI